MCRSVDVSTDDGVELWFAWKRAHEQVRSAVLAEVTVDSDISGAELTVLVHLSEAGGTLRQNGLVAAIGWDRTRLSHLLSRMEARRYLSRHKLRNGVDVVMEPAGQAIRDEARPRLSAAVDKHLITRLGPEGQKMLEHLIGILATPREPAQAQPAPPVDRTP